MGDPNSRSEKVSRGQPHQAQEETQSTRSMHNTVNVMRGNPVLLRLKELDVLEKIAAGISTLNVYSGLDGAMNDLVKRSDDKAEV